ncbi:MULTISPECIES: hypothetical protein [unclassified Clostridium]|uniref:hypothetical protein n=1 Tax=unclassified Clostridium TaxID=2614128 RepID=UPI000EEA86CE|nr:MULTISPECIES: hypothetical protein [unclassified Clostridium]HCQ88944.1 hypothetical protein [Clostridium sp.]
MKVVAQPIDMVAWFDSDGEIHPVKFRIVDETTEVVKINKIICKEKEKLAGNLMIIFRCQSIINNKEKIYEIKYDLNSCKWILFKI